MDFEVPKQYMTNNIIGKVSVEEVIHLVSDTNKRLIIRLPS